MSKKLSATMAVALAEGEERGGRLVRWRGGWWTYPGCPVARSAGDHNVPAWSVASNTVRALIDRGYAEVTDLDGAGSYPIAVRLILEPGK